ncbi:MAG: hypothetical protein OEM97_04910 [Acidimicrobiia bacterium]|nr:hypothetical protein [Acidimicrobiia bacterium]
MQEHLDLLDSLIPFRAGFVELLPQIESQPGPHVTIRRGRAAS